MKTAKNEQGTPHTEKKIAANIGYESGNCVTCHYFDPNYHGGYCDKHRCDTDPGATCRDYWRR